MYRIHKNIYINRGTLIHNNNAELLGAARKHSSTFYRSQLAGQGCRSQLAGHSSLHFSTLKWQNFPIIPIGMVGIGVGITYYTY